MGMEISRDDDDVDGSADDHWFEGERADSLAVTEEEERKTWSTFFVMLLVQSLPAHTADQKP